MPTEKNLNNLVINKVENKTVYDYMKTNNLINADELYFVTGADENATEAESGLMSAADKTKLDGIAEGAEANVQSDWNVTNTTSDAYIKNKPTALLADGGNADTVNNHTVETNVPADAVFTDTVYTHPNYTAKTNGLYKITVDNTGHVSGTKSVSKADITALGIPAQDTTYSEAGTSLGLVKSGGDVTITSGVITVNDDSHNHIIGNIDNLQATLDSKVDKVEGSRLITTSEASKLESLVIGEGGQVEISGKVNVNNVEGLDEKLDTKVDKVNGKGLSTNDYTTEEKGKLAGIETGANKTIVDSALSSTSANPVQNKIINTKFDSIQADIDSKVDAVAGKGLSTNDLTATLKSNYDAAYTHSQQAHAPSDAEKNVIVGIQKNGTDLTVNSSTRKVNITVPTKTSDLTNDSNFATTTDLNAKVDKVTGKGLSTNDYTTAEKDKLAAIEDGANKTIVDTALSSTSTNPVQNKVINTKFNSVQSDIDSKVPSTRTVNGKALSANITLSASDVGALPSTTQIPSIDGLATETYVDNKVAGIVDSAPATLDTLNELAAALGDDPNFATTVATQIGTKVDKVDGKGLSTNDYTTTEKTKLSGIAEGAEVNQNAFSNIVVGSTTVAADSKTDTLTLVAGTNVTLTPDATNDKITIESKDTVYTHPSYTAKSSGLYKITVNSTGHVSATAAVAKSDITGLGIPAQDTTYSDATTSASGLMSSDDKTKLNGIATGAEVNQNAFSNIAIGNTTIAADSKTDTLTLVAGDNVTLTPDATNDKITIASKDTIYTHPSYTARTGVPTANQTPAFGGTFNVSQPISDATGHITAINSRTITIPKTEATTSKAGLMSASDKSKLDGLQADTYLNKTGDTMTGALCFTEGVGFGTGTPASTITNPVEGQIYFQIISE